MPAKDVIAKAWPITPSADGKYWSAWPAGDRGANFTTTFTATESPVSAGGVYTVGYQQTGTAATGPDTTGGSPGSCYAHAADAKDYVALIQGQYAGNKHFSEVTVKWVGGYTAPDTHEIEIHVGTTIGVNSAVGCEIDLAFGGSAMQVIRWEDPPGGFNTIVFTTVSGGWPAVPVVDGDVIRAEFDSTSGSPIITIKKNGTAVWVVTDTSAGKIMSGNPGFGFFVRSGGTPSSYCIKGHSAGSLP